MGAGFRAAGISTQFRVREISIKDSSVDAPIEVTYEMDPKGINPSQNNNKFLNLFISFSSRFLSWQEA